MCPQQHLRPQGRDGMDGIDCQDIGIYGCEDQDYGRSRAGSDCSVALFGGLSSSVSFSFLSSPAQAPLFRVFIKFRKTECRMKCGRGPVRGWADVLGAGRSQPGRGKGLLDWAQLDIFRPVISHINIYCALRTQIPQQFIRSLES